MKITRQLLILAIAASTVYAFAPAKTSVSLTRLYTIVEKPGRVAIEEAAGQGAVSDKTPHIAEQDAVHGFTSKTEGECMKYYCMTKDPELQKKLERITRKRPYPLFLMEKAAGILDGVLKPLSPKSDFAEVDGTNGAINGDKAKEHLVILGTGWGAAALLQGIDNERYEITVISPRNYFLFTPMLAGAAVGTVDARSITQPIRNLNRKAKYLEAAATGVDPKKRSVTCQGVKCDETCEIAEFEIPYDRLVVAVGARVNTFGIPGVHEHCLFLKQVDDALNIRRKVVNLFEQANFPGQSEDLLRKILTFAIIGAGPTGVEMAAELRDFLEEVGPKYYPELLKFVSIKVIDAGTVVLRPFDESLQEAAIQALTRPLGTKKSKQLHLFREDLTEMVLGKAVNEVTEDEICLSDGSKIPFGLAIWAGGIGPLPITLNLIDAIGGMQTKAQSVSRGKLAVDPWFRVVEGEGRIFAIGDCVCTQNNCLAATAQVAAQEGEFLAHVLSAGNLTTAFDGNLMLPPTMDKKQAQLMDSVASIAMNNDEYLAPFQFLDLGILAYTGGLSALAQVQMDETRLKAKGHVGFGLWRGVYFMKQVSMRNRVLVFFDWMKARLFGRDITLIQ